VKLGIMLPVSGVHASPATITTIAQAAESLGYDSLWTYERLLRPMAPLLPGPDGDLERIPGAGFDDVIASGRPPNTSGETRPRSP
jgi:alkanesulfonate monooxygenase SsuD/methylene tetrahydromethanopterin reductase-like flavin-dependent oxidoreductase (luciferase family)